MINLYRKNSKLQSKIRGLTLIESMVGIAIFSLLAGVVYQTFTVISKQSLYNLESTTLSYLASQHLETARNLPYSEVGTISGNPNGNLPDLANPKNVTMESATYKIYYEVTYVDDPADGTILLGTDSAPNDYKQVKLYIKNNSTGKITSFSTNIVQTGLESLGSGGALSISVIDAVGQPVPNASINIINTNKNINLTRTSDANGKWIEVGVPVDSNNYHVVVTKTGYSSDQTYPSTAGNPDPVNPDATVLAGQVTVMSFAIDKVSNLKFHTMDQSCSDISNVGLGVRGEKLIGTPDIFKFDNTYTSDIGGIINLNNIEWDNYTTGLVGNTYMIYGSSPIQYTNLLPDTNQTFNLILGAKTANSLLVTVKDASTGNPIEGANVEIKNSSQPLDKSIITGGSLWNQQYWDGGPNQTNWTIHNKYYADDGNINTTDTPLAMRLINNGAQTTAMSGALVSSTFDTGSSSTTYTTLNWQPTSQSPEATVKIQIASNNDNSTWDFTGPDGTSATYYTTPNTNISTSHNGHRYIRYKAYLETTDSSKNPVITSVGINYISGCFTPGQVMFAGLANASYDVIVTATGYQTKELDDLIISGYHTLEVLLDVN